MKKEKRMSQEMLAKMPLLTQKEAMYFRTMWSKSGVLYITAKPGVAKSAIALSVAKKMGFEYEDIRLSMSDETDFKFPFLKHEEGGETVSRYAVPEWAYEANKKPTIIHFEELNRAPQFVRNAALQILLERQIGKFKFNDNVLMMASGNLGSEDNTDVEEFDAALNNRLIHVPHTLDLTEWIENYAQENVHPSIVAYIKNNPEQLYKPDGNANAYATPRSWTFLSDYIVSNYGMESKADEFIGDLTTLAPSFIGNSAMKFIQYMNDMLKISINDIINNYPKVKKELEQFNRDKKSDLLQSLKEIKIVDLKEKQMKNVVEFLKSVGDDERTAYLLHLIDEIAEVEEGKLKNFLLEFEDLLIEIQEINDKEDEEVKTETEDK